MRGLDANNGLGIFERHGSRGETIHVGGVLLVSAAAHAGADNIEHGEYPCLRAIDNAIFEVLKIPPAGAARVDHRRDPNAEGKPIGGHAVVAGIGVALARAGINVNVNIDQPWGHVQTFDIDRLER